jgi:hypothetical protein
MGSTAIYQDWKNSKAVQNNLARNTHGSGNNSIDFNYVDPKLLSRKNRQSSINVGKSSLASSFNTTQHKNDYIWI